MVEVRVELVVRVVVVRVVVVRVVVVRVVVVRGVRVVMRVVRVVRVLVRVVVAQGPFLVGMVVRVVEGGPDMNHKSPHRLVNCSSHLRSSRQDLNRHHKAHHLAHDYM